VGERDVSGVAHLWSVDEAAHSVDDLMTPDVLIQTERSTATLIRSVARISESGPQDASHLPGWSRLTIVCHLRYGAQALVWMTDDAIAGRPTSFYPRGRAEQRSATLRPEPGESPLDVVASLKAASAALDERWRRVTDWTVAVTEPSDNRSLGTVSLGHLALLRLTEVEVHGTDLGVGLGPWSDVFVREALPMRLAWLTTRRSNHRPVPDDLHRSWLLTATDGGPTTLLAVDGALVTSTPASPEDRADVVVRATSRELLALLLGRSDLAVASEFNTAFPGP